MTERGKNAESNGTVRLSSVSSRTNTALTCLARLAGHRSNVASTSPHSKGLWNRRRRRLAWSVVCLCLFSVAFRAVRHYELDRDLFCSVRDGDVMRVGLLCRNGADVNSVYRPPGLLWQDIFDAIKFPGSQYRDAPAGDSPLLVAIEGRSKNRHPLFRGQGEFPVEDAKLVELLLESGANPNFVNPRGESALSLAVSAGQANTCLILLARGANPKFSPSWRDPPIIACAQGDCGAEFGESESVLQALIRQGADVNARDSQGETALFYAVSSAPLSVGLLLTHGADPKIRDNHGQTALDAARTATPRNPEVERLLIVHSPEQ